MTLEEMAGHPLRPEDRRVAGLASGVLYLLASVLTPLMLALPGVPSSNWEVVAACTAVGAVWGIASLTVVRWQTAPAAASYFATSLGPALTAIVVASTGGANSPARFFLLFVVVASAYFYPPRPALLFIAICAIVEALPLLYDPDAMHRAFLGELLVVIPTYFVLGGLILSGKHVLVELRDQAVRGSDEQGALRRVATAVAAGQDPGEVYQLVSDEIAGLLGADASGILRFESGEVAVVTGSWSRRPGGRYEPGREVPLTGALEQVARTARVVRVDENPPGSVQAQHGWVCAVIAPVHVGDRLWGALAATSEVPRGLRQDAETRLADFADLIATAIVNTESRASLAAQASSDPLTGLANHRTFHDRLRAEVARARRHRRALALALIDVDHFKQINDAAGHEAGDRVLAQIAGRLRSAARAEDLLARIGGDEFALLLPESDRMQALSAIERARQLVSAEPFGPWRVTISAGICDLATAADAEEIFRLADGALYWSKAHGRDVTWVYDPEVVRELSAQERADRLQRSQAMVGLRALARAIDAKDPVTREHSERVAALAAALAEERGWAPERVALLSEAALVHDVGKIGVPDALLVKPGPLTEQELAQVRAHAALSAEIVDEVLAPEQVDWIRAHHERPDGHGYPRGIGASEISEGAALLAVADAWDVMTRSRPYSPPKAPEQALTEVRELVDLQFSADAVDALVALAARGAPLGAL
jgi:diguanylate cyclase (GGDEF)-like protein/putative nucleotidyltransferase with HDIG domain